MSQIKDCRKNLLQFLKLDDIKELFSLIGIEFVKKDFHKNQNPVENSEINEENNKKKSEQNRRKKEKKQKKRSDQISLENKKLIKNPDESKVDNNSKYAKIDDGKVEINSIIISSQENKKKRKICEENVESINEKIEEIKNNRKNKNELIIEYNDNKINEFHPENLKTRNNFKKILKSKNLNKKNEEIKLIPIKIDKEIIPEIMEIKEEYPKNNDNKSTEQNFENGINEINLMNNSGIKEGKNQKQELSEQDDVNFVKWNNFSQELAKIHSIKGGEIVKFVNNFLIFII